MSRDFLSSQIRTGKVIGGNSETGQPKLVIYSSDDASNNSGGLSNRLSTYLSNTNNYPNNTLVVFYGDMTTDADTANIPNPGNQSALFATDVSIQGTLFVNILRDINGDLIDFSNNIYNSAYNNNGIDLTSATSAQDADAILANAIGSNSTSITNLRLNNIENITIDENVDDDIILYWDKDNDKYAVKSSSALTSLPSIKTISDIVSDQVLNSNPFTAAVENYDTTLSDVLGNQYALLWSESLEKFVPGEVALGSDITTIQSNIDTIESDVSNLETLLNTHEASIGLEDDGTYVAPVGSNYLGTSTSIRNESILLDVQVKTNADAISTNTTSIATNTTNITNLQTELDSTQTGAGLGADGSYTADNTTNYIDNAISLKDADKKLDAQTKLNEDAISTNTTSIATNTTNISGLQSELDSTQTGAGLGADGTYSADNTTNYIDNAISLKDADIKLDTQIKTNADAIVTLDTRVDSAFTSITTNATNIATNAQNIAAIQQGAQNQAEVDQIETSLGLNADGELVPYTSTNFIDNSVDQDPQDTFFSAINKLDAAIAGRSIFNILGIDDTDKADGKILQYVAADNEFVYVDPQAGAAGADGADGNSIVFKGQVTVAPSGNGDVTLSDGITTFTPVTGNAVILNTDSTIYFFSGADWVSGGSIKGDTGSAGADGADGADGAPGADGADGAPGADAPTISAIAISGNDITTSFNGADDIVSAGNFNVSLGDLDNVSSNAPAGGQVLKWNATSEEWEPGTDNSGDGGADITVTDGTTSVATVETINVTNLASVSDGGNNTATLTGIIGTAEDTDYTDGLFVDFTNTTPIGTAIDRFNEVLKALAPAPAPDLDQFDVDTLSSTLQNIKLSFGTNNDQSAEPVPYASVDIDAGFDATDVNEIFTVESSNDNYRLGVFTGTTTIEGTLNEDVALDQYSNGIINYNNNSFSEGDQGTLELWLNGVKIKDVDLSDENNGAGDYLDANGSGFFNLSAATSGRFASDTEFPTFKHRQGSWRIHSSSQRNGWNYVQVKHVVGNNTKITGYADWVNDNNNQQISVSNENLSLSMQGSKYLSGIQYHTSGSATYTADIDNFYKYVYKTDNITFTETPDSIATFNSIAVPDIDTGAGDDHTKQINVSQTSALTLLDNRLLNQSLSVGFSLNHPIKSNILSANTTETQTGILVDNVASTSTTTSSSFDDEDYRQIDTNAYTQANLEDATDAYVWTSSESLVGADSGHNTGLLVYNSKLYSPKSSSLPNSGNFSTLSSAPAGNPNYSGIDNTNRVWIRKFKNETGASVKELLFSMSGNNSTLTDSNSLTSSQINVEFKLPSKVGQDETNWLSVADSFDLANYVDGNLTTCGDTNNGNMTLGTISDKFATFGLDEIADNDYILAKITAPGNWAGYVESFSVSFANVLGNINSSPEVSNIDTDQTGVTGKLSFGATNQITNFADYTQDINTEFDASGNKSGIFNNNTTITGQINNLTNSDGNNYLQFAFGGDEGNVGTLKLNVNGSDIHTIDLSATPYLTGSQLNANGSGFTNLAAPQPGRDINGRPDYSKVWRTAKYVVDPDDQRLGYNFAKVIHVTSTGDEESNTIEWINDNNTDDPDYTSISIDETSITSTETNSLSGVTYYKKVTNIEYTSSVSNMYKNIYSSESDAVTVYDTENNVKIKSILLTGVTDNTITNNGSHTLSGNNNSDSVSLPSINSVNDHLETLRVDAVIEANYIKSIPDLDSQTPNSGMNDITIKTNVKHPLTAANGKDSTTTTSSKILQYTVSTTDQTYLEETFENETKRLPENNYDLQADVSGAFGVWSSSDPLSNDLMMYDGKLIYPKGDFRDVNDSGSIISPSNNPDYSSETGNKTFYRVFQNNTQNAQTGFTLNIDGNGSVLVDPDTALSATNIKISVKIPETNDSQSTGFMNIAKDFETGNYADDDGALNGTLSANISSGSTTSNTITFGQKYLLEDEYFVLKIEADENWTGYLDNIEIVWS